MQYTHLLPLSPCLPLVSPTRRTATDFVHGSVFVHSRTESPPSNVLYQGGKAPGFRLERMSSTRDQGPSEDPSTTQLPNPTISPPMSTSSSTPSAHFNVSDVSPEERVLLPGNSPQYMAYNYSNEALRPRTISWCFLQDQKTNDYMTLASAEIDPANGQVMTQSTPSLSLLPAGHNIVKLDPTKLNPRLRNGDDDQANLSFLRQPMVMRIHWDEDGRISQSGVFTLALSRDGNITDNVGDWMRNKPGGEAGIDLPAIQEARPSNVDTFPGSQNHTVAQGPSRDTNHLSAGAIAGIIVGTVVALALAALALTCFLLRRRRQEYQKREAACALRKHKPKASMDGKDLGPPTAADSPRSPYAQDVGLGQAAVGAPQGQPDNRGLSPIGSETADHDDDEAQGGAPNNVAHHLVEEGMTEAEIRRLEEEERQLDAEIERAGHR
ncbi:hypothetical protein XA68_14658 [Ophiocordyceps unilateralis]|uniref:Mid2 domain-containing protein n=1 Tax=Ophiocordyceps unilateralis TaxID=268505 RepID=A0A2A9P9W9_OPHUN|nr:hypothetical protein XA68_14658 [Ophiocordyceps unilateralis]